MKRDRFNKLERDMQISSRNLHEFDCAEKPASTFSHPAPVRTPRSRTLTDEEIDLWITVARSVTPGRGKMVPYPSKPATTSEPAAGPPASRITGEVPPPPPKTNPPIPALSGVERRLKAKLAQGKAGVDAVLDLHGMHQHTAFGALRHFLSTAQRDGAKLVLVITGKGERPSADPLEQSGVLRRAVPHWLSSPDMRATVIGFEEATRPHGGSGALYVRIRRRDRIGAAKMGR
jgi:DNA-nicking Smr family endonuclease